MLHLFLHLGIFLLLSRLFSLDNCRQPQNNFSPFAYELLFLFFLPILEILLTLFALNPHRDHSVHFQFLLHLFVLLPWLLLVFVANLIQIGLQLAILHFQHFEPILLLLQLLPQLFYLDHELRVYAIGFVGCASVGVVFDGVAFGRFVALTLKLDDGMVGLRLPKVRPFEVYLVTDCCYLIAYLIQLLF